jgi:hypothetical protein
VACSAGGDGGRRSPELVDEQIFGVNEQVRGWDLSDQEARSAHAGGCAMIEYVLILLLFAVVVCNWLFEGETNDAHISQE